VREAQLAEAFADVLELPSVPVTASFFDLGGDSLRALRLVTAIRRRCELDLPLRMLFEHPSVAALAAATHRGTNVEQEPLVAIQPHGRRPPLFCVHAIDGDVLGYFELARRLGREQPLYGLQAWRRPDEPFGTTVEEMAQVYVGALRRVQPSGPYRLVGWSFGGVIAFEMARQLRAAGESVALLTLLDSRCPRGEVELTEAEVRAEDERALAQAGESGAPSWAADLDAGAVEAALALRARWVRSMRAYAPEAQPVPLLLLSASETALGDGGWGEATTATLEVRELPGNHLAMLRDPMVARVADELRQALAALEGGEA
jgi:thioesterase domain-containing protein/acyl carrier protein